MPRETVIRVNLSCEKCKRKALQKVTGIAGVDEVSVDIKAQTLTVIGDANPCCLLCRLKRHKQFRCACLVYSACKPPPKTDPPPKPPKPHPANPPEKPQPEPPKPHPANPPEKPQPEPPKLPPAIPPDTRPPPCCTCTCEPCKPPGPHCFKCYKCKPCEPPPPPCGVYPQSECKCPACKPSPPPDCGDYLLSGCNCKSCEALYIASDENPNACSIC